ncbi:something about silencing, SAS, complex subunit 4-domain-containing protein [Chaetomium sp. MPI-SDFR-AT-0129]|nr:something about silencing, SAS, complex subunit 4-domain-containing protein [Chaetomium sp. MPI-SDFR-AT-0129]
MALTASMTRSRRSEGLALPTPKVANGTGALGSAKTPYIAPPPPRPSNPRKRQLDPSSAERDQRDTHDDTGNRSAPAKKARTSRLTSGISVEIPAKLSSAHGRSLRDHVVNNNAAATDATSKYRPTTTTAIEPPKPAGAAPKNARAPPSTSAANAPKAAHASTQQQQPQQEKVPKYKTKVVNGLKHELDRLQPSTSDATVASSSTQDQGRKLRSQEATRFKSELSAYFPEYDEVIGNDPKQTHLLDVDTPIVIIPETQPQQTSTQPHQDPPQPTEYPIHSYGDELYTNLHDAQRIDFSFLTKSPGGTGTNDGTSHNNASSMGANAAAEAEEADPLPDSLFAPAHKKAERMERSIRNTEKGRAQHEKDQIIRLLDGLQGHDWLRVMGVSGVTETKKRSFEPARDYFIRGCESILDKFRRWAKEEKRRKAETLKRRRRDRSSGGGDEEETRGREGSEVSEATSRHRSQSSRSRSARSRSVRSQTADSYDEGRYDEDEDEPHDENDVEASAAKQLREEALAAVAKKRGGRGTKTTASSSKPAGATKKRAPTRRKPTTTANKKTSKSTSSAVHDAPDTDPHDHEPLPELPAKEFTSFFAKKYQRDAALNKGRRRGGRNVLAWGHPVPDMEEAEFQLPSELLDQETLSMHARRRRRDKRGKT